jgi:hypothetical protein
MRTTNGISILLQYITTATTTTTTTKQSPLPLIRERIIATERQPLVDEI